MTMAHHAVVGVAVEEEVVTIAVAGEGAGERAAVAAIPVPGKQSGQEDAPKENIALGSKQSQGLIDVTLKNDDAQDDGEQVVVPAVAALLAC